MLHVLNEMRIASTQGTDKTKDSLKHFMEYVPMNPEAEVKFIKSDMLLTIDSEAAYLIVLNAQSRAAGYYFLGDKGGEIFNGSICIFSKMIRNVMNSTT